MIATAWSRCLSHDPPTGDDVILTAAEVDDYAHRQPPEALVSRLTLEAIVAGTGTRVMLQGGAVADESGATLVVVAPPGMGTTTAVRHLARDRWGYVADEIVSVGASGEVIPFPRPLLVHDDPWGRGRPSQRTPDELGLRACSGPLHLGRLVLLDRRPDATTPPALEPVPLVDAVLQMRGLTASLHSLDRPLQRLCAVAEACGGVLRLIYRDIDEADAMLTDLLSRTKPRSEAWQDPGNRPVPEDSAAWGLMDGRVRRRPYVDAVQIDDEVLLLIDDGAVRLTGIGSTIWRRACAAPDVSKLVRSLVAEHGPHPDAERLVRDALATLTNARVLGYERPHPLIDLSIPPDPGLLPKPS